MWILTSCQSWGWTEAHLHRSAPASQVTQFLQSCLPAPDLRKAGLQISGLVCNADTAVCRLYAENDAHVEKEHSTLTTWSPSSECTTYNFCEESLWDWLYSPSYLYTNFVACSVFSEPVTAFVRAVKPLQSRPSVEVGRKELIAGATVAQKRFTDILPGAAFHSFTKPTVPVVRSLKSGNMAKSWGVLLAGAALRFTVSIQHSRSHQFRWARRNSSWVWFWEV